MAEGKRRILSKAEMDSLRQVQQVEQRKKEILEGWRTPGDLSPSVGAEFECQPIPMETWENREWTEFCTIIALDPGGTTGWSLMRFWPEAFLEDREMTRVVTYLAEWKHGQIDCGAKTGNLGTSLDSGISTSGEFAGARTVGGLLRAEPEAAVVIEGFDLRIFNKDKDLLSPERLKAVIGYELWLSRRPYFVQRPREKGVFHDERLKALGMYERSGGMQHARDADRHALMFASRCAADSRKGRELREMCWPQHFSA